MARKKLDDHIEAFTFPHARPDVRRFRDSCWRARPSPEVTAERNARSLARFRRDFHPAISSGVLLALACAVISIRASIIVSAGTAHPMAGEACLLVQASLVLGGLSLLATAVGWRLRPPPVPRTGRFYDVSYAVANVLLVCVFTVLNLIILPQSQVVLNRTPFGAAPVPVKVIQEGKAAILATQILPGTFDTVSKVLESNPGIETLYLMSPGGNVTDGTALAALVRTRKLRTRALIYCASACADVFVAGVRREIPAARKEIVGFHGAGVSGFVGRFIKVGPVDQNRLLKGFGVKAWFADKATDTPFEDIWNPDYAEMRAGDAADGTYGPYEEPGYAWAFEGMVAEAVSKAVPEWLAVPMERHAPTVLADTRAFVRRAHTDARSTPRVDDVWRVPAARVLARAVSEAPDRVVLKAGGYLLSGMTAAGFKSSAVCVRLGAMPDLILASRYAPNPQGGNSDTPWQDLATAAFGERKAAGWPAGIMLPDPADESVWAVKHGPATPAETCAEARKAYGDAVASADAGAVARLRDRFAAFAAGSGASERHDLAAFR